MRMSKPTPYENSKFFFYINPISFELLNLILFL